MAVIPREAYELFAKYQELLENEFRDEESIERMSEECLEIAEELDKLGYKILAEVTTTYVHECDEEGREHDVIMQRRELFLIPLPPANQTPIAHLIAVSKIYGPPKVSHPADPTSLVEEIIKDTSLSSRALKAHSFEFSHSDQHVFGEALKRHWSELQNAAFRQEIRLDTYESLELILSSARQMDTAGEEFLLVLTFLCEYEIEFLESRAGVNECLDCGCSAEEHAEILRGWRDRNLGN